MTMRLFHERVIIEAVKNLNAKNNREEKITGKHMRLEYGTREDSKENMN